MAQEISEPLGSRNTRHSGNGMAIDQMTGPPSGWWLRRGQPTLEVRWTPANCALRAASLGCDGPTLRREGASLIRYYDVCCGVASVDDDRPSSSVKVIERPFTPSGQPSDLTASGSGRPARGQLPRSEILLSVFRQSISATPGDAIFGAFWSVGLSGIPPREGRGCVQVIVSVAHSCSGPVAQVDRAAAF